MGLLKSNFQLQLAAKLVRDTFYPFTNGFSKRGHWGILETAKPKGKIIQNRKTAKKFGQNRKLHDLKTVKNRYNGDKWGIQSKLN